MTWSQLENIFEENGWNINTVGYFMDAYEGEHGYFPLWTDMVPESVLRIVFGTEVPNAA